MPCHMSTMPFKNQSPSRARKTAIPADLSLFLIPSDRSAGVAGDTVIIIIWQTGGSGGGGSQSCYPRRPHHAFHGIIGVLDRVLR